MIIPHLNWVEYTRLYSQSGVLSTLLLIWLLVELVFFIVFHVVLIPAANHHVITAARGKRGIQKKTNPYRAPYHEHKHLLLRRIVHRILMDAHILTENDTMGTPTSGGSMPGEIQQESMNAEIVQQVITNFITSWFHPLHSPTESKYGSSSFMDSSNLTDVPGGVRLLKGESTISSASRDSTYSSSYSHLDDSGSVSSTEENTTLFVGNPSTPPPESITRYWTIPHIYKKEADDFFAWSMFNKHMQQMTAADLTELEKCYQEVRNIVGLTFPEADDEAPLELSSFIDDISNSHVLKSIGIFGNRRVSKRVPRRLSLEYSKAWHRPFLTYVVVYLLRTIVTRLILQYCFGFVRVRSKTVPNLTGWYRPSKVSIEQSRMPMVFFHGIAPAGVLFYLPMLLLGSQIASTDRSCLLIDHYNISCTLTFDALSELETVVGTQELIQTYFPNPKTTPLAVCGHSFGSCCVSWLLNHCPQLRQQIQLCILLDPVTILLSDPHVMNNFLYSPKVLSCIRMVASSELFTEYYLRHHFSWYNSELWFDELLLEQPPMDSTSPNGGTHLGGETRYPFLRRKSPLHVVVALSENDEIVNAPKVKRHIDLFVQRHLVESATSASSHRMNAPQPSNRLRTLYWKNARHASCVTDPKKWRDLQQAIYQCELDSLRCNREHVIL